MVEKDRHDSDKPDSGPMLAKEITETKGRRLDVGLWPITIDYYRTSWPTSKSED